MSKSHTWQVLHSSADQCWQTPEALYQSLHTEFSFTLDAAALSNSAKCELWYGPDHLDPSRQDSLQACWCRHTVWLNPPYGRGIASWYAKALEASRAGATVVMLVMANTDTAYWHRYAWQAHEIRFIKGRVKFNRSDGSPAAAAPKGSAVVIFRPTPRAGENPSMRAYSYGDK